MLMFRKNLPVAVIEKLSNRKGELQGHEIQSRGGFTPVLEFLIPSRGLIGYRGEFYDRYQRKWYYQYRL